MHQQLPKLLINGQIGFLKTKFLCIVIGISGSALDFMEYIYLLNMWIFYYPISLVVLSNGQFVLSLVISQIYTFTYDLLMFI